jgi:hypothetical protein
MTKADDRSAARDFLLARLAAARASIADAALGLDSCLLLFREPEEDTKGKDRAALLEAVDERLGEAASSVQLAQGVWKDIDLREGEVDPVDEEEEEEEEDDEEEEDE